MEPVCRFFETRFSNLIQNLLEMKTPDFINRQAGLPDVL